MTRIKDRHVKGIEIFYNPDRILDYSKEHGSLLKFSLLTLLTGTLLGFNFFQANFLFGFNLLKIPLFLFLPIAVLTTFLAYYPFLIWFMIRIYLKISDKNRKINAGGITSKGNLITKSNLLSKILVISYCFLLPFLFFEIVSFVLTILLYLMKTIYLIVIIKDFGTILIYVWIVPLTLYSIKDLDKSQKYKMEAFILIALSISYIIQYFVVFALSQAIAKILPSIV